MPDVTISTLREKYVPMLPPKLKYMVLRRDGQDWTQAAKIICVFNNETDANDEALRLQQQQPSITFGVAVLYEETRPVPCPFTLVKATN